MTVVSLLCALLAGGPYAVVKGPSGEIKAPLFDPAQESLPVAKVGAELVTLRELSQALTSVHEKHAEGAKATGTDFTPALNRLIGVRLVLMESREMGIDALPEVREEMQAFAASDIRSLVQRAVTKDVKADPKDVERRYLEATRQWMVLSALFAKETDAKEALALIKKGKSFEAVVAAAVKAKKARGGSAVQPLTAKQSLPQILAVLEVAKPGTVTPAIPVQQGWTILKVKEIRHPDDPQAKAEAAQQALAGKKSEVLRKYYDGLVAKYVMLDEALIKSVDFEAKTPGFDALKKDQRVMAAVQGEGGVTIAEVCAALEAVFFHGIPEAITQKAVNKRVRDALDSLVSKKLVAIESRRRGLEQSPEHRQAMAEHEAEAVFSMFVNRAIEPGIKITEADGTAYYEAHKAQYMFPGFYTLSTIGFETQQAAQSAIEKLKGGADFKWLRANAAGQVPEEQQRIHFDGNTVTAASIPQPLMQALQGARPGDLRLYAAADGTWVVRIDQITEPAPQPYAEVRTEILGKIREQKITAALEDWVARLRKARDVQVYITRISI